MTKTFVYIPMLFVCSFHYPAKLFTRGEYMIYIQAIVFVTLMVGLLIGLKENS
ncbi:hypothetical protein CU017_0284 [Enterococcus lactis]|nr:hypothetical protein [Enterococcus lactis]